MTDLSVVMVVEDDQLIQGLVEEAYWPMAGSKRLSQIRGKRR
jgi:hypothetical protein